MVDEAKALESALDGGLSIYINVDGDTRLYMIFAGDSHIVIDEAQAMILAYALRGIIRGAAEMPQEVVN